MLCDLIIDGGNTENSVFTQLVEKLDLKIEQKQAPISDLTSLHFNCFYLLLVEKKNRDQPK